MVEVEEAGVVVVLVLMVRVVGMVLVLLFVHADGVLGLVEQGLVVLGGVLLTRDLVGGGLGGRLVGVRDGVTVGRLGLAFGLEVEQGSREDTNRWTLSTPPETESLTLSVVDLEVSGVILSVTSGDGVSGLWSRVARRRRRRAYCHRDPCGWRQTCCWFGEFSW